MCWLLSRPALNVIAFFFNVSFLFCLVQKWQEQAKKEKLKYDEAMKAYKESKANEPNESPEESKPKKKKGSVKEFFGKKEDKKKSSPRKSGGGESQKFKSAEFVDTDESSSEEEEKVSYDLFPSIFCGGCCCVCVCIPKWPCFFMILWPNRLGEKCVVNSAKKKDTKFVFRHCVRRVGWSYLLV